jgi:hypothetical protein
MRSRLREKERKHALPLAGEGRQRRQEIVHRFQENAESMQQQE